MPINGLSISDGATSIAATGGSVRAYSPDGQEVSNGVHVAVTSVADFRLRPHISFKNKNPQRRSDGTFSVGVRTITSTEPVLCTDGIVRYVTTTTEVRYAPEIAAATIKNARYNHAQLLFDGDTENFNSAGDLS